jgi:putative transposase
MLKEHEAAAKTADLCRKRGVSEATSYTWKSRFGSLEVSEAGGCGGWRARTPS